MGPLRGGRMNPHRVHDAEKSDHSSPLEVALSLPGNPCQIRILCEKHLLSKGPSYKIPYGNASVTLAKNVLAGCIVGLKASVSKNLNFWSNRFVAPTVMKPYRFGRR